MRVNPICPPRNCLQCGTLFEVITKPTQKFCSKPCADKGRNGPIAERFWRMVNKTEGCWLWTGAVVKEGYGSFRLNNKRLHFGAHRMSWILAHGEIADGLFVCHHCDNRVCVRPDHLFLGTTQANTADAVSKGRQSRGEKHGLAVSHGIRQNWSKLTAAMVAEIRRRAKNETLLDIAKSFGVGKSTIHSVVQRQTWKDLP